MRVFPMRTLPLWLLLLNAVACSNSLFDAQSEGGDAGRERLDDGGFAPQTDGASQFDADPAAPDANPAACASVPVASIGANTGMLTASSSNTLHGSCANSLPDQNGTEAIYKITLDAPGDIRLAVAGTTDTPDLIVFLLADDCGATADELACADNPDELEYRDAPAGTYYVVVEGYDADEFGGYQLDVETTDLLAAGATCNSAASSARCETGLLCGPGLPTTCQSATTLVNIEFTTNLSPATIIDSGNSGPRWDLCSQTTACFGNETGSASGGNSAIVKDGAFDPANGESLSTPSINASGYSKVVLSFSQYFYEWFACDDAGFIEVTTNGGATYTNIDTLLEVHKGYAEYDISSEVAGQTFSARFVYDDDTVGANCGAKSWQIDDIIVRAL